MDRRCLCVLGALLCLLLASAASVAQVISSTIYGNVADPSGAVIAGAKVAATNQATGANAVVLSDEFGEFTLTSLQPGDYTVTIEAPGFKTQRQTGLALASGQRLRVSYSLEVGTVTEAVEVRAEASLINSVNAEQRGNLVTQELRELPIVRRDWTNLLRIGTGIANTGLEGVSLNGLPPAAFRLTVDGTDSEGDPELPSLSMFQNFNFVKAVSLEAIEEINVAKGIASAEIANTMAGNVNLVTRRGTNEFHGSLFELNQTENVSARNQFLTSRRPTVFNQFGGSLGGPILRNKLFAFGVYEGYRLRAFQAVNGVVPTPEFRQMAIAAVPAYKPFFDLYDPPTQPYPAGAVTGPYTGAGSEQAYDNHAVVRGDYHITDHWLLAARYTRSRPFRQAPALAPRNSTQWSGLHESGNVSVTHIWPRWSSESRFGYNFNDVSRVHGIWRAGVVGISLQSPSFGIGGETLFKGGSTKTFEQIVGTTRGRHSIRFGGIFLRRLGQRDNVESQSVSYATVDDLLANSPTQIQATFGLKEFLLRTWGLGFFFQDDFKVSRRLILNWGIRYDYWAVPKERDNRIFNRGAPFGLGPLLPPDQMYQADRNNFSPRLGFAWTVDRSARTVIRGGAGMFHNPHTLYGGPVELVSNAIDEPFRVIFSRAEIQRLGLRYPSVNIVDWYSQLLPLVRGPSGLISSQTVNSDWPNPYSLQWTLSLQRQLTNNLAFETGYVGNHGVKLNMVRFVNEVDRVTGLRPFAGFGQFRYYDTSESSHYNSWQTSLRKRFSRDFGWNIHYTWARSISFSDGDLLLATVPQEFNNIEANRGPTPFDVNHRFASDFVYEVPFARLAGATGRGARLALAGWQFAGIFTAESGFPVPVSQPSSLSSSRPDYVGGSPVNEDFRSTLQYFNPAAFARLPIIPASGATSRPGNLGRNALRGPGMWNIDLALSKNLELTEAVRLQIRADMLNAFNHTNFSGIATTITAANFGRLTSTRGARVVQFYARLSF